MQHAVPAVRPFASEHELGAVAIELRAPGNQLLDARRPLFHQDFHRIGITQAIAVAESVLQVQADFIFVAERGNSTLGILRVGVGNFFFRQHEHTTSFRQFNRGPQARDTSADHYEVGLGW